MMPFELITTLDSWQDLTIVEFAATTILLGRVTTQHPIT